VPWFEDFNDRAAQPETAIEAPPPPVDDRPDPRVEAWTEGFLAGCRASHASAAHESRDFAAVLTRRVADIEGNLAAIADQSAATMGGLLIDMLTASLPPDWPADRLREIVAAIRPIFALEPRLQIRSDQPGEVSFRDLPGLYRAMEAGDWELAVRWHQAGADIDSADLAGAVRQAVGSVSDEASQSVPTRVAA